jgi:hypothetical protein
MEVSGEIHALVALPTRGDPQCPVGTRLNGPRSRYGRHAEEKNLYAWCEWNLDPLGVHTTKEPTVSTGQEAEWGPQSRRYGGEINFRPCRESNTPA